MGHSAVHGDSLRAKGPARPLWRSPTRGMFESSVRFGYLLIVALQASSCG